VEMIDLHIELDNGLITKTRELALQFFGDDSEGSMAKVLEVAFTMRYLLAHSVKEGQFETGDANSKWEFADIPVTEENSGTILRFLFRR
ncbi:hypothetical protein ACFLWE_01340, partial [Chloroflexota bacterium]